MNVTLVLQTELNEQNKSGYKFGTSYAFLVIMKVKVGRGNNGENFVI